MFRQVYIFRRKIDSAIQAKFIILVNIVFAVFAFCEHNFPKRFLHKSKFRKRTYLMIFPHFLFRRVYSKI